MELEEMLALMAAPIYAVHLANFMQEGHGAPSTGWKTRAMDLAVHEAKLLLERAKAVET